jgi:hypothetical protein
MKLLQAHTGRRPHLGSFAERGDETMYGQKEDCFDDPDDFDYWIELIASSKQTSDLRSCIPPHSLLMNGSNRTARG